MLVIRDKWKHRCRQMEVQRRCWKRQKGQKTGEEGVFRNVPDPAERSSGNKLEKMPPSLVPGAIDKCSLQTENGGAGWVKRKRRRRQQRLALNTLSGNLAPMGRKILEEGWGEGKGLL